MPIIRFLIIIFLSTQHANAFDFSRYEDINIDDLCKNYEKTIKSEINKKNPSKMPMEIFTNGKAYKIKLRYLGKIRPISREHYNDLISFGKALPSISPKVSEIATKEILVSSESKLEYWIPMQDALIPYLQTEIENKQEFHAYVIAIMHHINLSYKCSGTYLINEFQLVAKDDLK